MSKKLVSLDGTEFYGKGFGADIDGVFQCVFQRSMVGYQETITDPTYFDLTVAFTYPLIGNYGITDEDNESKVPLVTAVICRDYNDEPSNFRYTQTLAEFLEDHGIPGITGIDTRALQKHLRDTKSDLLMLCDADYANVDAMKALQDYKAPDKSVSRVSVKKKRFIRAIDYKYQVAILDYGVKKSIIDDLKAQACNVTLFPYDTPAEEILKTNVDGIILSNGPGNPEELTEQIAVVKNLLDKKPILAFGLGYQLLCLAKGAKTQKMDQGHYSSNHTVKNHRTNKIISVEQNHRFAVIEESLSNTDLELYYTNVIDGSVEAVIQEEQKIIGLQFDVRLDMDSKILQQFCDWMEE